MRIPRPSRAEAEVGDGSTLRGDVEDEHEAAAALLLDVVVLGMMGNVAVQQPFARPARSPDDVESLSWPDIHRIGQISRTRT